VSDQKKKKGGVGRNSATRKKKKKKKALKSMWRVPLGEKKLKRPTLSGGENAIGAASIVTTFPRKMFWKKRAKRRGKHPLVVASHMGGRHFRAKIGGLRLSLLRQNRQVETFKKKHASNEKKNCLFCWPAKKS